MSHTVFGHAAPVRAPAVVVVISHAYLSESFHVTVLTNVFSANKRFTLRNREGTSA